MNDIIGINLPATQGYLYSFNFISGLKLDEAEKLALVSSMFFYFKTDDVKIHFNRQVNNTRIVVFDILSKNECWYISTSTTGVSEERFFFEIDKTNMQKVIDKANTMLDDKQARDDITGITEKFKEIMTGGLN